MELGELIVFIAPLLYLVLELCKTRPLSTLYSSLLVHVACQVQYVNVILN